MKISGILTMKFLPRTHRTPTVNQIIMKSIFEKDGKHSQISTLDFVSYKAECKESDTYIVSRKASLYQKTFSS